MWNSEKMLLSLEQGDLQRADKYFQRALAKDDQEVLLELATYLQSIGFYPQAQEAYLQLQGDFPEVNLSLAEIAAEDGDLEQAFFYLDQIDKTSPDYLSSLLMMADLYDSEGLTDVAREKLVLASQLSDNPLITFGLAELDYTLGNFQAAIAAYAKLDNRDILTQTGISTYQRIGRSYAHLGKIEAAVEFLEKAVEIEYDDQTVFELACLLSEQEAFQRANVYFKQLETMSPDFLGYEYAYAKSLHGDYQVSQALALVQQGLTKNEFDSQLLLLASQLAYENHEEEQAEAYLLKAKAVAEDLEEVFLPLANLYLEQERYQEVVALPLEEIDSVLTKWTVAKAYQALDEGEKALTIYRDIYLYLTDNPDFLKDYAYLLREWGEDELLSQVLASYLKLVPDDSEMAYLLDD
ncbi:tetratricopeptide repeat protein [Streptococcus cuniculipharyngis]|uniref:Tetratricopeptide repeat protein n=1 Tax=Streptococcus cuniculipharyngis TaxID=1562651 RepID=A0A5C5SH05_9STRE|nr:tetratricopeptide repeat protein [Streptococcus cuniculipharyngis]TWS99201.1 tetratricopeptide repeat protein [Streptococcus cuniculipharyngis]